ncbi:MAG TPA: Mrp/NBP35 family ATP-binding protein [Bacteroidales bacterium]|nr:Mrp/NBP35 family ATP-binding protein [Bacteroidales bacterium]
MTITKEQIIKALGNVMDPDLHKDLVSLGMIEDIQIDGKEIKFKLILTTPACPLKEKLKNECIESIKNNVSTELNVTVELGAKVKAGQQQKQKENILPQVKNIVLVASGKGGVGKSTVAANLAVSLAKTGASVGLVDADIYGPSVPLMFDLMEEQVQAYEEEGKTRILPMEKYGIKLISIGFFVDPEKALIWRGPMASNALKQLFTDVEWGPLDYLIVDTPPGTGDIHLTLVQTLNVAGVAIVTTPQEVALADARKAINMFRQEGIKVPVLGLIENMSYFTPAELPENKYFLFGRDGGNRLSEEMKTPLLGQIPIVQDICDSADQGEPVAVKDNTPEAKAFMHLAEELSRQLSIWSEFKEIADIMKNSEGCSCKKN